MGDPQALIQCLRKRFPTASAEQLRAIAQGLSPMAADLKALQASPQALQDAATRMSQGESVDDVSGSLFPQSSAASGGVPGDVDPDLQAQLLQMPRTISG